MANYFNLSVWNKPASPCLSSRFPYGEEISKDKLEMVERAESILNDFGFEDVRVRTSNNVAKIEVPKEQISNLKSLLNKIRAKFFEIGYTEFIIDEE